MLFKKKYGQEILKITRNLEELIKKDHKVKLNIDFIIKCKRESLLFTIQFPEIPGTHFIDLGRMKG